MGKKMRLAKKIELRNQAINSLPGFPIEIIQMIADELNNLDFLNFAATCGRMRKDVTRSRPMLRADRVAFVTSVITERYAEMVEIERS